MKHLSVVVPVYNEENTLRELHGRLLATLKKITDDFEIIFVDDGSHDQSFEVMKGLLPLKAVKLRRNYGESTALAIGFALAQGEVVVTIEADLENYPEDIPALLKKIDEGYDFAIGCRENRWQGKFFSRYLPSWAANKLISKITGTKLKDNGCQLRAYRRDLLNNINMRGERHRMIAVFVLLEGGRIAEVPVSFTKRKFGKSKYGISRTFKVLLDLLAFHFFRRYASRPIHFFGGLGFVGLFLGFLVFLWATYMKFFEGVHYNRSPLMVLTSIFVVIGFQFVLMGLLAEIFVGNQGSGREEKLRMVKEVSDRF